MPLALHFTFSTINLTLEEVREDVVMLVVVVVIDSCVKVFLSHVSRLLKSSIILQDTKCMPQNNLYEKGNAMTCTVCRRL